ncbi:unnamed protein product [Spirodela intermedia]|uniref:KOW domain-containing protein n=1 Tax=Spirodela intermedia TaxID=51605 RepID=A0A7I8JWG4_SPIIN|nr:unnamed protein product [Spirodela intermedia]
MAAKGKGKRKGKQLSRCPLSGICLTSWFPCMQCSEHLHYDGKQLHGLSGVGYLFEEFCFDIRPNAERTIDVIFSGKNAAKGRKSNAPFFLKEKELSGSELEEFVEERYGRGSDHVLYDEDDKEYELRKSLLHCPDDPAVWRVRCKVGHERQSVFCLIQKFVSLHSLGSKLPVVSVFFLEHIKGYVYIEADKQHDITETQMFLRETLLSGQLPLVTFCNFLSQACKGFSNMYTSKMDLVPRNEVPGLLSIQNMPSEIAGGTWVRLKHGNYKGDLAQVVAVDGVRKRATVKLVPRIDLRGLAKKFVGDGSGIPTKQAAISAPRLINSHELEIFRPHIKIRRDSETGELFEILDGLMLKDGYLYKKVSFFSLSYFGVQPSKTELLRFEPVKNDEPQGMEWISHFSNGREKKKIETFNNSLEKGNAYQQYDLVLFGQKDFGVIISMESDSFQILKGDVERSVLINVQRKDIKNSCINKMFAASDCNMKTICINDTVKITEGLQKGRLGIIKHIYKGTLFIYDKDNQENNGYFCAKSELCEVIKETCSRNMSCSSDNLGTRANVEYTVPQTPAKCSQRKDFDGSCMSPQMQLEETNEVIKTNHLELDRP